MKNKRLQLLEHRFFDRHRFIFHRKLINNYTSIGDNNYISIGDIFSRYYFKCKFCNYMRKIFIVKTKSHLLVTITYFRTRNKRLPRLVKTAPTRTYRRN